MRDSNEYKMPKNGSHYLGFDFCSASTCSRLASSHSRFKMTPALSYIEVAGGFTPGGIVLLAAASLVLYLTTSSIYYAFFHPLAKVPGPRLYSFTQLPFIYYYVQGKWERKLEQFHNQYGPAVRFTHKDVSFITVDAFKKIYGHKNNPDRIFEKDKSFYKSPRGQVDLTTADNEGHRRGRRILAHAFSERALRGQEDIMQEYVGKFISQLTSRANHGDIVDIVKWFNFTTFDIIGDLAFGEPFGCLDSGGYHPWVRKIFESVKIIPFAVAIERLGLGKTMYMLTPPSLKKGEEEHFQLSKATALKRIKSRSTEREDFMSYILRHNDEKGMTESEIAATSRVLIIAGSETTATLLSGATFYLLTNRDKYEKLVKEIRSSFSSKEGITIERTRRYLAASPDCHQLAGVRPALANLSKRGKLPLPEDLCSGTLARRSSIRRRLPGSAAAVFDGSQKLHCLAYAEMRLILTHLIWNFDLELMQDSKDWDKQRAYFVWEKGALNVKLTPVSREKQA
ncbi:hypothetical protein NM208_g2727 [Fusarium decemcellulare]|uniref:Uncharacterized protein n=1 Tax=Fusarium decemcellulare TaxID=57161 RepID=A0ACC1SRQ3_9HYPO|nr:hypothetical protein NM208_g2727 [Fusarium decemcellulare]